jgi:small-conductance mechanosensitive channel
MPEFSFSCADCQLLTANCRLLLFIHAPAPELGFTARLVACGKLAAQKQPLCPHAPLNSNQSIPAGITAPSVLKRKIFRVAQLTFIMHRIQRAGLFALTVAVLLTTPRLQFLGQAAAGNQSSAGDEIIGFLNQSLVWYRQQTAQQRLVSEPSDVLFLNDSRRIADQVVQLAFGFARSRSQALASQGTPTASGAAASSSSQHQRLSDLAAKADQQVKQSQQDLAAKRKEMEGAVGKKRRTLQATVDEMESELELFQARRDALRNMMEMRDAASGKLSSGTLQAQIDELARTVPAAETTKETGGAPGTASANSPSPAVLPAQEHRAIAPGILALISDLFSFRRKVDALDESMKQTDALAESARGLRAPLLAKMRELTQKGDQLAAQADSSDPAVLAQQKKDLDALTAEYKQLSASLLPLGKLAILLDLHKHTLNGWRSAVDGQYKSELKGLLLRLGGLALVLGVVLGVSEVWRRATFRYVTDVRRRNQFLLIRRIVVWSLIAIIIAIAFASELGAITTFAGLLTAGIVVALQNVILAVAGYFFLIGKYGVRVGDRVQVAGITGDVVDIGMVRLHLMEVTGGTSPRPTGRIVVFSNSVVFQAGSGLFKPIPGTSFLWHEITLTLSPESNYLQVEKRLLDAVNKVYAEYRDKMDIQRRSMERSLRNIRSISLAPESRLRLAPSGLEVAIRYPVESANAAEMDDRVTRELLEAIGREPKLRLLGGQIEAKTA